MEEKTKSRLKGVIIFAVIIIGYLAILALTSWMFRKGVEDESTALLVISGISLVIHSFFIIWLNFEFSFRKAKKKKTVSSEPAKNKSKVTSEKKQDDK